MDKLSTLMLVLMLGGACSDEPASEPPTTTVPLEDVHPTDQEDELARSPEEQALNIALGQAAGARAEGTVEAFETTLEWSTSWLDDVPQPSIWLIEQIEMIKADLEEGLTEAREGESTG